jgi:hypothetical protein
MKKHFSLLYIILCISACETVEQVELPDVEKKLVVNCLFNPDSLFRVHVTRNASRKEVESVNYYTYQDITDAEVNLYKNDSFLCRLEHSGNGYYSADEVYPECEVPYRIEVASEDYNAVWAESYAPRKIELDTFYYERLIDPIVGFSEVFKVNMVWADLPGKDYYYLYATKTEYSWPDVYSNPGIFVNDCPFWPDLSRPELFTFDDRLFDTDTINFEFYCPVPLPMMDDTVLLSFYLAHTNEEFFLWANGLVEQNTWRGYFSEPVQVFNNIHNGLGLFTGIFGYVETLITFKWFDFRKGVN